MQLHGRPEQVARLAGVNVTAVEQVPDEDGELLLLLTSLPPDQIEVILDAMLAGEAHIWVTYEAGDDEPHYWYDNTLFGEVVALDRLAYNSELGLHVQPPYEMPVSDTPLAGVDSLDGSFSVHDPTQRREETE